MKTLIPLALVLTALTAGTLPALAQSYDPGMGSGNIVPGPKGGFQSGTPVGQPLYNYAPLPRAPHRHMSRAPRMEVR